MSDCDRVRILLSARIDEELDMDESKEVDSHMATCSACQHEWSLLKDIDQRLAIAIAIPNLDSKCAAIMEQARSVRPPMSTQGPSLRLAAIATALAATILVAMVPFFRERKKSQPVNPTPIYIAQLVRATGPVHFRGPGEDVWTEIGPDGKESLIAGSSLKTREGVLCELHTTSKGIIRLNESAEVVIVEPNQVALIAGQLWCLASEATSIDVSLADDNKGAPLSMSFSCPRSTELQCVAGKNFASCDSVSSDNSVATVTVGSMVCAVAPGESVSIDREQNIDRQMIVESSKKVWQLPLLAIGSDVDQELVSLLDRLLSPIGMTKTISLNEQQIRRLGPRGAIPLLAYAVSEKSSQHLPLRRTAVRIGSEIADQESVRLLKLLTGDSDAMIASFARTALERIVPRTVAEAVGLSK